MLLALACLLRIADSSPAYARIKSFQICRRTDRLKSEEQHRREENRSNISSTYPRNNYLSRSFRSRGDPLSFVSPTINSRDHDTQILPFSNLRIADDDLSHRQPVAKDDRIESPEGFPREPGNCRRGCTLISKDASRYLGGTREESWGAAHDRLVSSRRRRGNE